MSKRPDDEDLNRLQARVDEHVNFALRSRSALHLEAAIASMLDCYTLEEAAKRLELEAMALRQWG